jgi:aldehyde dehydrogenase (NAD+)
MTQSGILQSYDKLYIGGAWVTPSSPATITLRSPSTEDVIATVPDGAPADIDRAVEAARSAFDDPGGWSRLDPSERAEILERFAVALEKRGEETAHRVTAQNGMPWWLSTSIEAVFPSMLVRYYSQLAQSRPLEEVRPGMLGGSTIVKRQPVGVVGAVVPWNVPQALTFMKVAPALAAGCTVVLKPAPETVLDQYLVAEAAEEAGLPAGVLNIVQGGRDLGAHLVSHPGVDKVAFTGSTAAGRKIAETCGRLLRPVSLELGGKSAAIVLEDAKLEDYAEQLFAATLFNNGQTCFLNSRILVPKSRYSEVVEFLGGMFDGVTVGDPFDPQTQVGPMTSDRQRERVLSYIDAGRNQGARVVAGGGRPKGLDKGFFVEPTVLANVGPDDIVAQEEIFGPVLVAIPYDDVDDAVRIANNSAYGLGGSVWTQDPVRGAEVARRVHTGSIGINAYVNEPTAPFGGVKASGLGRELGPEGLEAYYQLKSIYLDPNHNTNEAGGSS